MAIDHSGNNLVLTSLLKPMHWKKLSEYLPEASWWRHSAGGLDGLKWLIVLIYSFNPAWIIKIQVCRSGWIFTLQNTPVRSVKKKKPCWFFDGFDSRWEVAHFLSFMLTNLRGSLWWKKQKITIIGVVRVITSDSICPGWQGWVW